jgi:hypothetical protein
MGGIHEGHSMIPDNPRKKLEQLRQEMALRAQLNQQYDKEMKKVPLDKMISFKDWMAKRQQHKAPYEDAHEQARLNAINMLGLHEHNTAQDRAKAMGFDLEAYHGTDAPDIKSLDPERTKIMKGVFSTTNPKMASRYAEDDRKRANEKTAPNVLPLLIKSSSHEAIPKYDINTINDYKNRGAKGVYRPEMQTAVTFDPSQIRSRFAAFDPAREHEHDLLAAKGGAIHMSQGGEPTQDAMRLALTKRHGLYSPLEKAAIEMPRTKGTGAEFMTELSKRPGFKAEEVADRRIPIPEGKMTKAEFLEHLKKHSLPPLQEHTLDDYGNEDQALEFAAEELFGRSFDSIRDDRQARQKVGEWVEKNSAKYNDYQLPGGKNYREMLLQLPNFSERDEHRIMELEADKRRASYPEFWGKDTGLARELENLKQRKASMGQQYNSSHWQDHPNVLAHMRLSDRKGPNGEKLLHLEELQSDWHQAGRRKGYKDEERIKQAQLAFDEYNKDAKERLRQIMLKEAEGDMKPENAIKFVNGYLNGMDPSIVAGLLNEKPAFNNLYRTARDADKVGVPDAPFKKSWHEMALKHAVHHAAKHGYHGIVITPGQEQADRYDLSKHVSSIMFYTDPNSDTGLLKALNLHGEPVVNKRIPVSELDSHIGKEAANKILKQSPTEVEQTGHPSQLRTLNDLDLQVGGEGMKGFYDKIVPTYLNKLGKPHGVQVGSMPLKVGEEMVPDNAGLGMIRSGNPKITQLHHFPITEPMREKILKEGLPQYMRGGVIHKAEGGKVQPTIAQMRVALQTRPSIDLQSIGVNEAPNMSPKVYLPPEKEESGMPAPGGVSTSSGMPIGGIDMSKQQAGQQLMPPQAPPQPPQGAQPPQGGQPPQPPQGMPPMGAPQGGGNILEMTPQGQTMAALSGGQKPQGLNKGGQPKVEVKPTVFDDKAVRRHPEIENAAKMLVAGHINQKEFDRVVQKHKPVKPYDFVPTPATDEQAMDSLDKNQKLRWRDHEQWPSGHKVGLRLDIPSYEKKGVWVNSIHDESGQKPAFKVSYGPVSSVRNAEFHGTPHKALEVATGEQGKRPFAKIVGDLEHINEDEAVAHMVKHLKHPDYRQVGYDPRRHGDFYDRETMQPVTHSEHVVQIGPLVLAKRPKYGKRTLYKDGGKAYADGGGVTVAGATGSGGFDLHIPISVGGGSGSGSGGGSSGGSGGGISSIGGMMGQGNASSAPSAPPPPTGMYTSRPQFSTPQQNLSNGMGGSAPTNYPKPTSLGQLNAPSIGQPTTSPTSGYNSVQSGVAQPPSLMGNEKYPLNNAPTGWQNEQPDTNPITHPIGINHFPDSPQVLGGMLGGMNGQSPSLSAYSALYGYGSGGAPKQTYEQYAAQNNAILEARRQQGLRGEATTDQYFGPTMTREDWQRSQSQPSAPVNMMADGGNVKKPTVAQMKEAIFQKAQEGLMRPSEALGKHEGKFLHITEADRAKVENRPHGMRGGVGFSQIGLENPDYAGRVWGVGKSGTAIKLLNREKRGLSPEDQALWTTFIGTPEMHTSNQLVFNRMWNKFQEARKQGLLSPEQEAKMLDLIRSAMTKGTEKNPSKPVFDPDVSFDNTHHLFDTFERRRILSNLMAGNKIGGKKAQIFDASKMIEDTTDPRLLHAPTMSVGPHVFSFSGETSHEPKLNKAFPFMLHGEAHPEAFRQIPFEHAAPDFVQEIQQAKGRAPGYMDIVRRIPRQHITEKYLTGLQKLGLKKGGKVKLSPNQDTMRLELTRKK